MEISYLLIVAFMFTLAIIDLTVGVSNDAVNFLSSAVGSRAAKLKTVLFVRRSWTRSTQGSRPL